MSVIEILETLLIGPLKLVFEIIFVLANRIVEHPGLAIIALSLVMNILVLPLYRRADEMQENARDIDAKLQKGVAHIKKSFSGDERMMILQTYYRQNNYKPTDALNGSVSLLLEVPFFMAAYQFLSSLALLEGASLGPIADLSKPDSLIVIGSIQVNLLPILMTLVNVISSALYLKGFPLKTKIQLYGMAGFFLVFLYTSPSGLVFYWTLNNLFSLVKTIFYKLRNPKKVLTVLSSICGLFMLTFGVFFYHTDSVIRKLFVIGIGLMLQVPIMLPILLKKIPFRTDRPQITPNRLLFILGTAFLTVLLGLLIPSAYIASSPQEYINPAYFHDPMWYVASSLCYAAGTFLVWMSIFYWLSTPKIKIIFERVIWVFCGIALVNYMFFGTNLGNMSPTLQFDGDVQFAMAEKLINIVVIAVLSMAMFIFVHKRRKAVIAVLFTATIALTGMSVINLVTIGESVSEVVCNQNQANNDMPTMQMSKNGKNVLIIMLDRAMGEYAPYIFNEKPELREQFAGFTYYSNVISHGGSTNFTTPSLYGGYEYTPVEINKRGTESLVSKQNEALLVLPVLFSQNNFKSTVFDPPYTNYEWNPDISIFEDYPEVNAFSYESHFVSKEMQIVICEATNRNLFCLSIMKSLPLVIQPTIYASGTYLSNNILKCNQTHTSITTATGIDSTFQQSYMALSYLPNTVHVSEETDKAFICATFQITHQPTMLSVPDYTPATVVDNTQWETENADRFLLDGRLLKMETVTNINAYHTNMAAYIQVGNFLDALREYGVYDNTRIIIVSDHGNRERQLDQLILDSTDKFKDVENYFPLLMVKDFNSTELTTCHEFMTIADVATLATKDVIENPINPFTGKVINNDEKYAHDQIVIVSNQWNPNINNGNTFLPARWASIHDDLWVAENWTFYDKEIVLTEHALPEN